MTLLIGGGAGRETRDAKVTKLVTEKSVGAWGCREKWERPERSVTGEVGFVKMSEGL